MLWALQNRVYWARGLHTNGQLQKDTARRVAVPSFDRQATADVTATRKTLRTKEVHGEHNSGSR